MRRICWWTDKPVTNKPNSTVCSYVVIHQLFRTDREIALWTAIIEILIHDTNVIFILFREQGSSSSILQLNISITISFFQSYSRIEVTSQLAAFNSGGWHNVPQDFHLNLILLAIVDPDGNQTILSRALLDANFGPLGRNQHPTRRRKILFDRHPDVRLRVK